MTPQPLVKGLSVINTADSGNAHVPNVVCNVNWADLQDTAGGPIKPGNPIDKFIATGKPGVVRLFMGGGYHGALAPSFVRDLGQVFVIDPASGASAAVPRWWEPDVQHAQRELVALLAAMYDGRIPLIYIANSATIYAEPFQRGVMGTSSSASTTRANLLAAGYTPDLDQASYIAGYSMFGAFKTTRLAQSFNPWQYVDPDTGHGMTDATVTISMMDAFAAKYPHRAVWANNSIRTPTSTLGDQYQMMYQHMRDTHMADGRPLRFQTATSDRIGDYAQTLQWAVDYFAHCVEIQPGWQTALTDDQLAHYDALLRAN